MKKVNFLIFVAVAILLVAPAGFGFAQSSLDLGAEGSGLLPSNPFYFLKEWGRGFKKFITFNPIRKAELELTIVSEKAAELKKLEEITPENIEALVKAAANYRDAVEGLRNRFESTKETSNNPNVDRLLTQLVDRSLKHQKLFDDLQAKFEKEEKLKESLRELEDKLADVLTVVLEKLDLPEKFKARFQAAVDGQEDEFKELRAAALLDRLEEKLSTEEAKKSAAILKDDLLIKFSGRLQGLEFTSATTTATFLEAIPGENLRILKLLDEIRERVLNPDLKNELNLARQKILEQSEEKNGIGKSEAEKAINKADDLVTELENKIKNREGAIRTSVKELLERAKFNLAQAKKLFEEENYGGAFGQATAASATARNALAQLLPGVSENSRALEAVKNYYDSLVAKARFAELTKEKNPKLFELFLEAEKKIVEVNQLLEKRASPEAIAISLRNVKLILATIEQLIKISAGE